MRIFNILTSLLIIPLVFVLMSSKNGSVGGKTGSPADGNNCTQCHSGVASGVAGWITHNIPAQGYTPGNTYIITLTGTHSGVVRFGFELTSEDSLGDKVGTFGLVNTTETQFTNSNAAVTHTVNGITPSAGMKTWTVNWTAPANVNGAAWFYAAFNAANGNSNTSGDAIYTTSVSINEYILMPGLMSIVPAFAEQGQTITTTISGENTAWLTSQPSVELERFDSIPEIYQGTNISVISDTVLQADFTFPITASLGFYDLYVDGVSLMASFEVVLATGLNEINAVTENIYPNPSNGIFTIEAGQGAEIEIFSMGGTLVYSNRNANRSNLINLSEVNKGIYILRINQQPESSRKIVIR